MSIDNNENIWDEECEKLKKDNNSNFKNNNNKKTFYKKDLKVFKTLIFVLIEIILIGIILIFLYKLKIQIYDSATVNELSIKYNITNIHNLIKLFDISSSNIINSITSMEIDNKKVKPSDKYKFNKTGIYNIKIRLKSHLNSNSIIIFLIIIPK